MALGTFVCLFVCFFAHLEALLKPSEHPKFKSRANPATKGMSSKQNKKKGVRSLLDVKKKPKQSLVEEKKKSQ